ncbi:helix-turn-helix transcriptional regulator [Aliiruegeria lutimaris]|uniref:helix-turn-helix transcriptional regulator n=1 Tax=Aliiruegeria lutimaris TaxID=571298 RepID=UPI001BAFE843|nr:helix-turn-helix domain-containing protein [Aliiruegeria lutimaris]
MFIFISLRIFSSCCGSEFLEYLEQRGKKKESEMNRHNQAHESEHLGAAFQYLRPRQAAEYLGISESTLAKLRMRNNRTKGPRFASTGSLVIYRKNDLDIWVNDLIKGPDSGE